MRKAKSFDKWGRDKAQSRYGGHNPEPEAKPEANFQAPQFVQDSHDTGLNYDNDASGWTRGKGKPYPYFDSHKAGR